MKASLSLLRSFGAAFLIAGALSSTSGFGAWTFGITYSVGDAGFADIGHVENEKVWDSADFSQFLPKP